jgi:hypothetical protein
VFLNTLSEGLELVKVGLSESQSERIADEFTALDWLLVIIDIDIELPTERSDRRSASDVRRLEPDAPRRNSGRPPRSPRSLTTSTQPLTTSTDTALVSVFLSLSSQCGDILPFDI